MISREDIYFTIHSEEIEPGKFIPIISLGDEPIWMDISDRYTDARSAVKAARNYLVNSMSSILRTPINT